MNPIMNEWKLFHVPNMQIILTCKNKTHPSKNGYIPRDVHRILGIYVYVVLHSYDGSD